MPHNQSPDRPDYRPSDHLSPPQPDRSWRGSDGGSERPRTPPPGRRLPRAPLETESERPGSEPRYTDPRVCPVPDRSWRSQPPAPRPGPPPAPPAAEDDFSLPGLTPRYSRAPATPQPPAYVAEPPPAPPPYRDEGPAYYEQGEREIYQTAPYSPPPLSIQQRYDILLHTIELYKARWRLAHVRANQDTQQLQAYLTPRNAHLSIRQAHQANQLLVIAVDANGNVEIREPQRRRWWHRLLFWRRERTRRIFMPH